MQPAIADAVNAVFNRTLSLRNRVEAGETMQWDAERTTIVQRLADFDALEHAGPPERDRLTRTTIRRALECWLDEWFRHYATPSSSWHKQSPGDKIAAETKFWEEARSAETRCDIDALEVMHRCVMLGYRGAWRDKPEQLYAWTERIRQKLADAAHPWAMPAAPHDNTLLRRMAFSLLLTASLLAPLIAVLRWRF
jgi:Type VI secretion system protein DotU